MASRAAWRIDPDRLASFLDAGVGKYGQQVAAVLGSTLNVWPALTTALLQRLGIDRMEAQAVRVAAEVATGKDRDAVDIQLLVLNANGSLARRLWIEVKIDDRLAKAQAEKDGRPARDAQLLRYRSALAERDAQGRVEIRPSVLALLALKPSQRDLEQVHAARAEVITWQWLADLVAATAAAEWGQRWERDTWRPNTPAARDAASALLWFMDDARPPERRKIPYLGVVGEPPLTSGILLAYREAPDCLATVFGLLDRAEKYLSKAGWVVEDEDESEEPEPEGDEDNDDGSDDADAWTAELTDWLRLRSRSTPVWWQDDPEVTAVVMLAPHGEDLVDGPVAFVKIEFPEPIDTSPAWLEQLESAEIHKWIESDDNDEPTGKIEALIVATSLASILHGTTLDDQSELLARWAIAALKTLSDARPPAPTN